MGLSSYLLISNLRVRAIYSLASVLMAIGRDGDTVTYTIHYATENFNIQGNQFGGNKTFQVTNIFN